MQKRFCRPMLSDSSTKRYLVTCWILHWLVMAGIVVYFVLFLHYAFRIGRPRDGSYFPQWFYLFGLTRVVQWEWGWPRLVLVFLSTSSWVGMHLLRKALRGGYRCFRSQYLSAPRSCDYCSYSLADLPTQNVCPECGRTSSKSAKRAFRSMVVNYHNAYRRTFGLMSLLACAYIASVVLSRHAWSFNAEREFEFIRQVLHPVLWFPLVLGFGFLDMYCLGDTKGR